MPYSLPPVIGVKVYRSDVVVVRGPGAPPSNLPERGEITEFSDRARQRLAFIAANTDVIFRTMITLTYPGEYSTDGSRVKANLKAFLDWLARDLGGRPSYLWFLEFQQRGAPHYHVLIDYELPRVWIPETVLVYGHAINRNRENPKARADIKAFRFRVSATWYRIVGSADPKHLAAGTRVERVRKVDGAARYAVKYALKMRQKRVPAEYQNVGRFYGYSKDVVPTIRQEHQCTEDDIRGSLEGWKYEPRADRALYNVLYGVSGRFMR